MIMEKLQTAMNLLACELLCHMMAPSEVPLLYTVVVPTEFLFVAVTKLIELIQQYHGLLVVHVPMSLACEF